MSQTNVVFVTIFVVCCDYLGFTLAATLALSFSRYLVGQPVGTLSLYVYTKISMGDIYDLVVKLLDTLKNTTDSGC